MIGFVEKGVLCTPGGEERGVSQLGLVESLRCFLVGDDMMVLICFYWGKLSGLLLSPLFLTIRLLLSPPVACHF